MTPAVVVICGPTASGKTALAVELALRLGGEVVSADSMQVYRRMDIGTAKPTREEMRGVPHHLLDVAEPEENYSVARYVQEAVPVVDGILRRGRLPIIAGGTGLYIDALIAGRAFAPSPGDTGLREELERRAAAEGLGVLRAELEAADPAAAARIHPNDAKRTIRALEVWRATGKTISRHNEETLERPPRYRAVTLGLSFADRADLRARISRRVDEMFRRGLEGEVRALLDSGVGAGCTAMQAIGYKELAAALAEGRPAAEAAEEIKLRSGQYAKRQLTWFRRDPAIRWLLWEKEPDFSAAVQNSTVFLHEHGIR